MACYLERKSTLSWECPSNFLRYKEIVIRSAITSILKERDM